MEGVLGMYIQNVLAAVEGGYDKLAASSVSRLFKLLLSAAAALIGQLVAIWWRVRADVLVPAMRVAVLMCTVMSMMILLEKLSMGLISLYAKVFRRRPARRYKCDAIVADEETGTLAFPMVLVQIPMYNEKEVYQLSIRAACNLTWPGDRIIIQVLDDSTDPVVKELIRVECEMWRGEGKNIRYETRANRQGYKAGALKVGMDYEYVQTCEYVAVFDADFQPDFDFLVRTIPFLVHNPKIALVQARWRFVNAHECLMTRLQQMSMDYHFKVEQESESTACAFFGYNGTAGVWRIKAIADAGGWNDRSTVEDMDLAIRAGLAGWKFIYTGNLKVKSELPSTFKAYRFQQHRWSCGGANLFRKLFWDVLATKNVSPWMKFYVIYNFFFARRIVPHFVTFMFYCVIIPLSAFFPEVDVPKWGAVYIPTSITLMNSVGTPRSFYLVAFWVLFENVMAMHRCKAVIIGFFETGRPNEWVVTEKLGDMLKSIPKTSANSLTRKFRFRFNMDRFHILELILSVYLLICATYDCMYRTDYYFVYIFPQSISFFLMGLGYIGTIIPADKKS